MAEIIGTNGNDTFQNVGGGGTLMLVLAGSAADGGVWPNVNILVNGAVVQSNITIDANNATGETKTVSVPLPANVTSVGIQYTNDSQVDWNTGDRNLYIKSATVNNLPLDYSSASYVALFGDGSSTNKDPQPDMVWGGTQTFAVATNDTFNGLAGIDTIVYSGGHAEYGVTRTSTGWSVTHGSEADALVSVERLQFSDHKVALDVDGNAGWAVKIISALFGPQLTASASFVGVGIDILDAGMSPQAVIQAVVNSPGFSSLSGSNETFVRTVYQNLTGSTASQQFVDNVVNLIDSGQHTKESIGLIAAGLVGVPDMGIIYA